MAPVHYSARIPWALALALLCGTLAPEAALSAGVDVCHVPPGNSDQRRVIRVSPAAAERHIGRHGDALYSAIEQCDGVDDDCDGAIDEPFRDLGRACSEGLGVCAAAGSVACDPRDPSQTRCSARPLEPTEPDHELTCTGGLDEDCDGLVDDDDPDCAFDVGRALPSAVDLPIAINCCAVAGPSCAFRDYCALTEEPINPCLLSNSPSEEVSCLEFAARPELNACWSVLDGQNPSISTPALFDVLDGAPITAYREPAFVDNGDKISFSTRMNARMYGSGSYEGDPAGVDRYPDVPGIDSWVVRLPVIACQTPGNLCAGGAPEQIIGALCFEIREIEGPPDRFIKGRFLCPDRDPVLFAECALGPAFVDD